MVNSLWLNLRNLSLWFSIFLDDFEHTDFHTENVKKSGKVFQINLELQTL